MNLISNNPEYKNILLQNFLRYVKTWSESSEAEAEKGTFPSTPQQWDMAHLLENELKNLGMKNVTVTDKCYVYANLEATSGYENKEPVLFLAHLDTVDEVSGKDVKPQLLSGKDAAGFSGDEDDTVITSDKSTLLGGDDKAGIASIMTALTYLCKEKCEHAAVEVIFSPDEETGHGMDYVPLNLIESKYAYTVDGGHIGELETECFNAFAARITFTGKACHTGYAKANGMINASILLGNFLSQIPSKLLPENTEKFEGFIAPMDCSGTIETANLYMLLRSFTMKGIEEEKQFINQLCKKIEEENGGTVQVEYKQQYLNMKEKLDQNPMVYRRISKAFENASVQITNTPIRGGTDGSRLTEMGIPTPNIFTGAHEFHSRNEWCSLNQMSKASDIILNVLITNIKK